MNFRSVLIVTYGRSGSTLLQGLVNSISGCLVRGENNNFCYGLYKAYQALCKSRSEYGKSTNSCLVTSPWYGAHQLNEDLFLIDAREMVKRQLMGAPEHTQAPIICYGFKEIRYLPNSFPGGKNELKEYLAFLCKLFPEPAIIVLTRRHEDVAKSAWWNTKNPTEVALALTAFEDSMREFSSGRANVFSLSYEDIVARSSRIADLFSFLGADYDEERIINVLETRHSYTAETVKQAPQHAQTFRTRLVGHEVVRHCTLEYLGETEDKRVRVGGVVVLKDGQMDGGRLMFMISGKETSIEWGLPSPKIGARYSENIQAKHARYRSEIDMSGCDMAELVFEDVTGKYEKLALIERVVFS